MPFRCCWCCRFAGVRAEIACQQADERKPLTVIVVAVVVVSLLLVAVSLPVIVAVAVAVDRSTTVVAAIGDPEWINQLIREAKTSRRCCCRYQSIPIIDRDRMVAFAAVLSLLPLLQSASVPLLMLLLFLLLIVPLLLLLLSIRSGIQNSKIKTNQLIDQSAK